MKSKKKLWIRFVIIMAFAVLFLLFALFAGKFAPYDPLETHYTDLLKRHANSISWELIRWEGIYFREFFTEEKHHF